MQNQSKYFLNNREVSEEEFYGRNNLSVSNPFRGEKQVNEAVKQAIGLSTRHKAGKTMTYLDEVLENNNCNYTYCGKKECKNCYPNKEALETKIAFDKSKKIIEQSQKDDTITNVYPSEEEMAKMVIEKYNQSFLDSMYFKSPFNETKKSTAINQSDFFDRKQSQKEIFDAFRKNMEEGVKETEGKADYSEINLNILDLMSERMQKNKHKYPKDNSKKPMDVKGLEWALFRHIKKMIQPIENDPESYKEHLAAVLCNASMILNQLELKNNP